MPSGAEQKGAEKRPRNSVGDNRGLTVRRAIAEREREREAKRPHKREKARETKMTTQKRERKIAQSFSFSAKEQPISKNSVPQEY